MAQNFLDNLKIACNGFRETVVFERSFRIMLAIAALVAIAMFYFPTSHIEKIILLIMIFAVLILELINTAVERIMDVMVPERDERVRIIKDLMAAVVLLASFGAALVGILIFLPYVLDFFG